MPCSRPRLRSFWRLLIPALLWVAVSCKKSGSTADGSAGGTVRVVYDQSLGQVHSLFDVGFAGMSRLVALLRDHRATVSVNNLSLRSFLPSFQGAGRVLVLDMALGASYAKKDLAAIRAFLKSGGGVLALTEHDNLFGNADFQNALTGPAGMVTRPGVARGRGLINRPGPRQGTWPACRVERWGLDDVYVFFTAPLKVRPPAEPLVEIGHPRDPQRALVGAFARVGRGRLVVLADTEILWNMTPRTGIRAGNNPAFLLRLFGFLSGSDSPLPRGSVAPVLLDHWGRGDKLALFESTGRSWFPDGAPNGLHDFAEQLNRRGYRIAVGGGKDAPCPAADLVVVAVPLESLELPDRIRKARRVLLLADGRTDFLGAMPPQVSELMSGYRLEPAEYRYPLNPLAAPEGFRFLPVTLVSGDQPNLVAEAAWVADGTTFAVIRSTAIKLLDAPEKTGLRVVARSTRKGWPLRFLAPLQVLENPVAPYLPPGNPAIRRPRPVVVRSRRVMAVADVDLLCDQGLATPGGARLLAEVSDWLSGKHPSSPDRPAGSGAEGATKR